MVPVLEGRFAREDEGFFLRPTRRMDFKTGQKITGAQSLIHSLEPEGVKHIWPRFLREL